jgi:hypothetical protein
MTENQFVSLCESLTICPEIALEDEQIQEALTSRDDDLVRGLLKELF